MAKNKKYPLQGEPPRPTDPPGSHTGKPLDPPDPPRPASDGFDSAQVFRHDESPHGSSVRAFGMPGKAMCAAGKKERESAQRTPVQAVKKV